MCLIPDNRTKPEAPIQCYKVYTHHQGKVGGLFYGGWLGTVDSEYFVSNRNEKLVKESGEALTKNIKLGIHCIRTLEEAKALAANQSAYRQAIVILKVEGHPDDFVASGVSNLYGKHSPDNPKGIVFVKVKNLGVVEII